MFANHLENTTLCLYCRNSLSSAKSIVFLVMASVSGVTWSSVSVCVCGCGYVDASPLRQKTTVVAASHSLNNSHGQRCIWCYTVTVRLTSCRTGTFTGYTESQRLRVSVHTQTCSKYLWYHSNRESKDALDLIVF